MGDMMDSFNRLARMMRTKPAVLLALQQKMDSVTGQEGVFDDIIRQNDITVQQTLLGLGLNLHDSPATVRQALVERLSHFDRHLYVMLDQPDLTKLITTGGKLWETALKVFTPPAGVRLKREIAIAMLEKYLPHNLLEHFGYANTKELIDKEGFSSVMASLRFSQTTEWMHQFFEIGYSALTSDDFEMRGVEFLILDDKWLTVAEKFLARKYHNVSHLKEFGIIFVLPVHMQTPGETLRLFTLLLHYLHEVPYYADLFLRYLGEPDFSKNFKSLLRGDVSTTPLPLDAAPVWRVVQRYLAKENADDFRLFEPHVSPEADHWWRAEEDLGRLSRILGKDHGSLDLGWWRGLDFVGEFFTEPTTDKEKLVSFDLIDLLMSLVRKSENAYLYHHQEALWNKIFVEYIGRERMQRLTIEHMIDGFIRP